MTKLAERALHLVCPHCGVSHFSSSLPEFCGHCHQTVREWSEVVTSEELLRRTLEKLDRTLSQLLDGRHGKPYDVCIHRFDHGTFIGEIWVSADAYDARELDTIMEKRFSGVGSHVRIVDIRPAKSSAASAATVTHEGGKNGQDS